MKNYFLILILLFMTTALLAQQNDFIDSKTRNKVRDELIRLYGENQLFRIERGIEQTANLWNEKDGTKEEFTEFCLKNFAGTGESMEKLFDKLEFYNEIFDGYFNEMSLDKNMPLDLELGDIMHVDLIMGAYSPSAHLTDDFFLNKYAFIVVLNFPDFTLAEKNKLGKEWDRKEWAFARLGRMFQTRIPADIKQKVSGTYTMADHYISEYNIYMNTLVDGNMKTYFPENMKLISHWGLRDELKALYSTNDLFKQQMIYRVMERIILQEIPEKVINSPVFKWNPFDNKLYEEGREISFNTEPDTRYETFLKMHRAIKLLDPYYPALNTHILRSFEGEREISVSDVEKMFEELLTSPQVKEVASVVKKKLGRDLQPFDLWFTGFKGRSNYNPEELDKITKAKYPTAEAFEKDIKNILLKLGFSEESASYIAPKIRVDAARGSGHAAQSSMRIFKPRLRTRVQKDGMDYKGYNIAIHELGHSVEQVLTLYKIDYYSLAGVPNTSFTEAFAFVFQDRDLELLGLKDDNPETKYLRILGSFWSTYEIIGVSLVDMKVWHWLYEHPDATPAELKNAVVKIAKDIWNKYYADVFGVKDALILAIYSHMIDNSLYLPNYAIGHIIQFQIEEYLKDKNLGTEMERMCVEGNVIPQVWMKNAVGSEISVKPMLLAVGEAVNKIK